MNRMRETRKQKRMTMKQLGQIIGVAESTISMYETGKHEPDNLTLVKIADALDVTIDYLLGRSDIERNDDSYTQILGKTDNQLSVILPGAQYVEVSPFEKTILETYRRLSEIEQVVVCRSLGLTHPAEQRVRANRA